MARARGPRRGILFVCGLGAGLGLLLSPAFLLVPAVMQGHFFGAPLGTFIIDVFILGLAAIIGLVAGLVGSGVTYGVVALLKQRETRLGIAVFLLVGFAVSYGAGAFLAYGLGANSDDAASSPVLPAAFGAVLLTTCWAAWRRRPRDAG